MGKQQRTVPAVRYAAPAKVLIAPLALRWPDRPTGRLSNKPNVSIVLSLSPEGKEREV
jgi:hypothetical protein